MFVHSFFKRSPGLTDINFSIEFIFNFVNKHFKFLPSVTNTGRNIKKIIENPKIGTEKVGDLQGIFVYKFYVFDQQFLLAYTFDESRKFLSQSQKNLKLTCRKIFYKILS